MLSQNFIFGEGESAKAVFTNLNPGLKRSHMQISGNKIYDPTPAKKPKLSKSTSGKIFHTSSGSSSLGGASTSGLAEASSVSSTSSSSLGKTTTLIADEGAGLKTVSTQETKIVKIVDERSSPLKRHYTDISGPKNAHPGYRKRTLFSVPKSDMGDVDPNDPNTWVNFGYNMFGEEETFYSRNLPELITVTKYNDFSYRVTKNDGRSVMIAIEEGGSGWIQNQDIRWTDD